ncbi:MAG TPA: hypothetical protein PK251_05645 [Candidatus Latescibacteria bacterium]|nr:hypothetical protein [Candidatus Latescibacterota bacterium]HOS64227.1 hypothetical protein [Candidatus Latescibacterota bacterium]HPK74449.1 hypothetical protein [Candidatus Latescibacterota bacterium]
MRRKAMPLAARLVIAVIAFSAAAIPPLIRYSAAEEAEECARRREAVRTAALRLPDERWWNERGCPRDGENYRFAVGQDSTVEVVCPKGHGIQKLPVHRWFSPF